jgi:alkylhydroperoxidase family enzyme
MHAARIAPVEPPYSEVAAAEFDRIMPPGVPPLILFRVLAVNERVFSRVMAGGLLDKGSITLRERELVIDRTCFRCGSEYEWGVHVAFFAARAGLSDEEIAGLCADDPEATAFAPRDRLLLRLCDELHATSTLSDALYAEVAREWSPAQIVELVVLAGLYHMISFLTNGLRLPNEAFAVPFRR